MKVNETELGLYVHFPWCVRKCPYCDFNSHQLLADEPGQAEQLPASLEASYIKKLLDDYQFESARTASRANNIYPENRCKQDQAPVNAETASRVSSIFIGGGTPSLMRPDTLALLLEAVRAQQGDLPAEVTIEANPGAADAERFAGYRQAGVNRISIGAQSFSNESLAALGRIHQRNDTLAAFHAARQAGFGNINLDLMHGLPGQSVPAGINDLQAAIALGPEHISWYQLTIEPNTRFHSQPPVLPDEATLDDLWQEGARLLQAAGYQQYEISAWSKPGYECQHNLNYWQFGDYLGVGAGAHGKITTPARGSTNRQSPSIIPSKSNGHQVIRTRKTRVPRDYMGASVMAATRQEAVPSQALAQEYLMNGLRLNQGFTSVQFEARTGLPFACLHGFIAEGESRSLLVKTLIDARPSVDEPEGENASAGHIAVKTTELGRRFLDTLLAMA